MGLRNRMYLSEGTFNMDRDVDWIYKASGLDKFDGVLRSGDPNKVRNVFIPLIKNKIIFITDSSKLNSRICKRAHLAHPVSIHVVVDPEGSFYKPIKNIIQISFYSQAIDLVIKSLLYTDPLEHLKKQLGIQFDRFVKEFDKSNVKGTIYHELNHWASDAIRNDHITKEIDVAMETGGKSITKKWASINQHPMEIDAQVHAIKAIRSTMGKREYDRLSWEDLFRLKGSLMSNLWKEFGVLLPERQYVSVIKRFAKRLHREGLLGKGLRKLPSRSDFGRIISRV